MRDSWCAGRKKKLVCTEEETAGHTHAEDCYTLTETGNINCTALDEEGHVHTDECYEKAEMLTCGIEETSGHIHTDNCYETIRNYTCGKEEIILHKHDDKCYSTDENGRKYLSCGRLETYEHEHDENCFQEVQAENDTHMHADQCFEPTAEEAESGQTESIVEETESVQMEGMVEETVFAQTESMAEETGSVYSVENAADDLLSDTELKPYLQSVTIQDGNGTLVDGTVYVGESYKIRLVFAETKGGTQFNADIDTWTYQLPSGIKVAEAQNQKMTITITENNVTKAYETTYSIDTNGLITVHLNDALKEAVIVVPNASFDINLNAEVSGDQAGEGAEIVFEGSSDGIKFNTSIRPSLSVAKSVEQEEYKDDHNNSIGGKLSYTVTGNVVNGPVKGMTFVDAGGYSQDYFGKAEEIKDKLQITSVVIRCGEDQENHQKILTADDYSLSWEGSKFTLQINENIQMNDCDTIEMKYTIPYQAAKGVSYYKFDVDNTVTFSGTTVQPDPSDPVKGEPEPDEATNQTTVSGGTAGIRGMVKTIDDKDYDTQGVLYYTVKVDVSAGNYWPFYMWDDLSVLLDGETYRVDAALKNMKISITDVDGVRNMINLNEQDPDWLYHLNNAAYPCPTGDYFAHLGKGVNGNWKNPGAYDIVFNPVDRGNWDQNTSLNLPKDSEIEVTYDIDVDEEIGLYTYDDKKLDKKIKLRDYLSENGGAAIGLDVDFYDEFQQGWEYVEGTLTGTIDLGTWAPTFYYLDYFDESEYDKNFMNTVTGNKVSPVVKGSHAIHVSWNGFGELKNGTVNIGWNLASCLRKDNDTYLNKLIGVTFNYKLRPTEEVGKNLSDKDTVNVHNEAAIRVNGANVYEANHDLTYAPKHLSKTAKQNGNGSNVESPKRSWMMTQNLASIILPQAVREASITLRCGKLIRITRVKC